MRVSNRGIEIERAFEVYNFRLMYRYILDASRVKMAGPFGKLMAGRMDGDLWVLFSIHGGDRRRGRV